MKLFITSLQKIFFVAELTLGSPLAQAIHNVIFQKSATMKKALLQVSEKLFLEVGLSEILKFQ